MKLPNMNIVIPMAGKGSRFIDGGYETPKPLIEIHGKPMIEWVVESTEPRENDRFIFIVQQEHLERYELRSILTSITNDPIIIPVNYITEGQASSILLAEPYINTYCPMISFNCDQIIDWERATFEQAMHMRGCDGGILTFYGDNPKWSYAELDEQGWISRTVEKEPISKYATVGAYAWRRGMDFVKFAKEMIWEDARVNGEFYACPVYNWAIRKGGKFITHDVTDMYGTGTPDELSAFIKVLDERKNHAKINI